MLYPSHRVWSPWRELDNLQREMNRLFETVFPARGDGKFLRGHYPPLNVWTGRDDVKVVVELPGMKPEDINISVMGNTLTISGERRPEEPGKEVHYHRHERGYGKFIRTVELPVEVDSNKVEASYRNGCLTITLPRAEEQKPKQITVKAG